MNNNIRLGKKGIKPEMEFQCNDCSDKYTGEDVLEGRIYLYIIKPNLQNPIASTFRCELCQEDIDELEEY